MTTIDIFGTCFSRELFNYSSEFKVNNYLMQQSIYTMNSNPLPISYNDIVIPDDYEFKKRMVFYEFNKLSIQALSKNPSDYFLIDVADQARDVIVVDDYNGALVIKTSAIIYNLQRLGLKYHVKSIFELTDEQLIVYIKSFLDFILSLYPKDKIILNEFQIQREYYENGIIHSISENNFVCSRFAMMKKIEKIIISLFPGIKVLSTKQDPILNINHRLGGPYPAHFEDIYYKYRVNLLSSLINDKDSKTVEELYVEEYLKSIESIKKKRIKKRNSHLIM